MRSIPKAARRASRRRVSLALCCFTGATLLMAHAGFGQPEWPFDFVLPQPPPERPMVGGDESPLRLVAGPDARRKVLERSRELSAIASAPSERPPRERRIEIPELPPAAAALLLPPDPLTDHTDEEAP